MTVLIFLISLAALVLGILMFMAAGMADETGQDSPTWLLVLAGGGLVGVAITLGIWIMRLAHWLGYGS